ncbi:MAG: Uma2 family endonuclease [Chitinophagaceae bacterium]|nr:Uma2 family endonuclease [Chitinophagaceae bacterium]
MGAIEKIIPYYTYEDYIQWEGKWEIIDGLPFAMAPTPVYDHQLAATNLSALFWNALQGCEKCKVLQPLDYIVKNDTVLQPDMLVVCRDIKNNYLDFPPSLVCEILSPSTALKDRHTKYNIYEAQKIPYYIIVSTNVREVEVFFLQNGKYVLINRGKDFTTDFEFEECTASINFGKIW